MRGWECKWFGISALCLLMAGAVWAAPHTPLRIMPLGDSITYGTDPNDGRAGGYRAPLRALLTDAGYSVDYVGTVTTNPGDLTDVEHEGHRGWCIADNGSRSGLYEYMQTAFSRVLDPHIILLHIGTNDTGNDSFKTAIDRWDLLIDRIAEMQPSAHIIATTILNRSAASNQTQIENYFNPFVEERVAAHRAKGQRVHFLDMNARLTLDDLFDGLHPSVPGYGKMANAWFEAITAIVTSPEDYQDNQPAIISKSYDTVTAATITLQANTRLLADSVATLSNYALDNGITVKAATLSSDLRTVTLTLSGPIPNGVTTTLTVSGLQNEFGTAALAPTDYAIARTYQQGAEHNVPASEFNAYELVYSVDLPASKANYGANAVPYTVDRHEAVGSIGRIAYYVEIRKPGGDLQYLWVSMDAFTEDAGKIALPTVASGAIFQQPVSNLKVWSNVVAEREAEQGNIEFWPGSYSAENAANVAGASGSAYDFGDRMTTGNYGSFQVHDTGAQETLFAYNRWGGRAGSNDPNQEIGIGNCTASGCGSDWTFSQNSAQYDLRRIQVYVMPKTDDTVAPRLLSATLMGTGRDLFVRFSEGVREEALQSCFALDKEFSVVAAAIDANDTRLVRLTVSPAVPSGIALTLTAEGVRDLSAAGNALARTEIPVSRDSRPSEVLELVDSALTEGYELLYSADLPAVGGWKRDALYTLDFSERYDKAFDRVAYFVELVTAGGVTQYVWTAMDAFTENPRYLGVPFTTNEVGQVFVTNLDVASNVSGIQTGTAMSGGFLEFWPWNYGSQNALNIPNASGSTYDFGDSLTMSGDHSCMQVHNYEAKQTLWSVTGWNRAGYTTGLGIGNRTTSQPDWTTAQNAYTYVHRRLHVLVRPKPLPAPAPDRITERIPDAADYTVLYEVAIPTAGKFYTDSEWTACHEIDNSAGTSPHFSRVAYFLELVPKNSTETHYIWTAFDTVTGTFRELSIPSPSIGAVFQRRIANLDVFSNVDGIVTGRGIQSGNIEFTYYNYGSGNSSLPIPGADGSKYDFNDLFNTSGDHGCLQVHNWGAKQTLFAINCLNRASRSQNIAIGIGDNPSGQPDWTTAANAANYQSRRLTILVNQTNARTASTAVNTLRRAIAARDRSTVCVSYATAADAALADPACYQIDDGAVAIRSAARSASEPRDILLTLDTPLAPSTSHTLRALLPEANTLSTATFTTLPDTLPAGLAAMDIPEIGDYRLINLLPIGDSVRYSAFGADYQVDESRFGTMLFDRVAYCLELESAEKGRQWIYVSMDAFTDDLAKIGLPTVERRNGFQVYVDNLMVYAGGDTVPPVQTGAIDRGNIQFFTGNISAGNEKGIPNASDSLFDWGDKSNANNDTEPGFGALQICNYQASENLMTVAAYSYTASPHWRTPSLGIGTDELQTSGSFTANNWFFRYNAASFTTKNLYVLVRPKTAWASAGYGPALLRQPQSGTVLLGTPLTLEAYAPGSVFYQWMRDGVAMPGETGTTLTLDTSHVDAATYTVAVYYDAANVTLSDPAVIRIVPAGTEIILR